MVLKLVAGKLLEMANHSNFPDTLSHLSTMGSVAILPTVFSEQRLGHSAFFSNVFALSSYLFTHQ